MKEFDYLSKCLVSIWGQTYSDLEIILMNDGYTDNSSIICEEYAHKTKEANIFIRKMKVFPVPGILVRVQPL